MYEKGNRQGRKGIFGTVMADFALGLSFLFLVVAADGVSKADKKVQAARKQIELLKLELAWLKGETPKEKPSEPVGVLEVTRDGHVQFGGEVLGWIDDESTVERVRDGLASARPGPVLLRMDRSCMIQAYATLYPALGEREVSLDVQPGM